MVDKAAVGQQPTQYTKWKMAIPFLYDWFANHNLTWPSLSCRWGANIEDSTFKRKQFLYLSERTDLTEPNKLMLVPVELCKPRVAAAESISGFHEKGKSPFVKPPHRVILHPGEVNKIRELPENPSIVATHSDAKDVFVWHFDRQPDRGEKKDDWNKLSDPDLTLTGHSDIAEFALATSSAGPFVASGGRDAKVLLWNLGDYDGGSLLASQSGQSSSTGSSLAATSSLSGHESTIGEVVFKPKSTAELASVGDDCKLLFWDTRQGHSPAAAVPDAHRREELRCIDWSLANDHLVATGAEDGSLRIWDMRSLAAPLHTLDFHARSLIRLEWANYKPGVLASGGEDGSVAVWDLHRKAPAGVGGEAALEGARPRKAIPTELMFQHAGHQAGQVADFQWHPSDPFTMVSVSDDPEGGTLQLWRINDLIYRPEAEVIAELEQFKDVIVPREKGTIAPKPEPGISNGLLRPGAGNTQPQKTDPTPPLSTGGSAPAATPAEAFVGVPEGVAVSKESEEARIQGEAEKRVENEEKQMDTD